MGLKDYFLISDGIQLHDGFMENMNACLYAAEKHAVVFGQLIEDKPSLINTAKQYLPEYSVITPDSVIEQIDTDRIDIDCVMIKQSVIEVFGQPEQSTDSMRESLADYCSRINKFGFSSLIAHHALYYRSEELGDRRGEIGVRNEGNGKDGLCNPFLHFLTLLDDEYYPKKKILFDCILMQAMHCGTTEVMLSSFDAFYRLFKDKYDIYLHTNREAAKFHSITDKYENILYPDTIGDKMFHLGYAPNQLMLYEYQLHMNKHCLRIVQNMLDLQMVRIDGHFPYEAKNNVELGVKISDGIVFISNFGKNDFFAYYEKDGIIEDKRLKVIYIAKSTAEMAKLEYNLPFDEFFLVAGGPHRHKAINETIEAVRGKKFNYIAIGTENSGYFYPNVYGYKGGQLDEGLINHLYANCKAVIFPSLYEGYGLPTLMGLMNGKCVILFDNEINRELFNYFNEYSEQFIFINKFEQINDVFDNMDFSLNTTSPTYSDSWDRAAIELESFFTAILSDEVDGEKLRNRWWIFRQIEARTADVRAVANEDMNMLRSQFGDYRLLEMMRFAMKENIKQRHQKLYMWLKGSMFR